VLRDDRQRIVAEEGRTAGHHFVERGPEAVEVAAYVGSAPECLLGGHVSDRPHHHTLNRHAGAIEGESQTEVAELGRAILGEPDVARLEVPMDHAVLVGVLEGAAHLTAKAQHLVERQTLLLCPSQEILDGAASHVLAHDVDFSVLVTDVVNRDYVRVVAESAHRPSFSSHPGEAGLVEIVGLDERDGDVPLEA
jgi:hypothetical protein